MFFQKNKISYYVENPHVFSKKTRFHITLKTRMFFEKKKFSIRSKIFNKTFKEDTINFETLLTS